MDPRVCGCRGVMPRTRQFISMTVYPFKDQGGEECSDSLASLIRSPVSPAGRASDLQAEGHGFESYTGSVTYIRVTGNSKDIPILNSNCSVVLLTQVNEGESISFIYTICFYRGFAIHSVISLLFTKTFYTFTNTEIV